MTSNSKLYYDDAIAAYMAREFGAVNITMEISMIEEVIDGRKIVREATVGSYLWIELDNGEKLQFSIEQEQTMPVKTKKAWSPYAEENTPYRLEERVKLGELYKNNSKIYFNQNDLDKYYNNNKISYEQFCYGDQYRNDFHRGGVLLFAQTNIGKERLGEKPPPDIEATAVETVDAGTKWRIANESLIKLHVDILTDVCCLGYNLKEFESLNKGLIRDKSGIYVLRDALDYLGKHYKNINYNEYLS